MRLVNASLVILATLLATAACGGGDDSASSSSTGASTTVPTTSAACAADTRKDVYVAGLTKNAGTMSVKLMSASPSPPSTGVNTLSLELLDATGAAIDGATLTVTPWMPDHAHGSSVKAGVVPAGGGMYTVSNVYLVMAGLWQVKVSVQRAPGDVEEATFQFCLDG